MNYPSYSKEYELFSINISFAGIDEVGRGCLAGPVVAGIVAPLSTETPVPKINDSKLLSESAREDFANAIYSNHKNIGVGEASCLEIDSLGIMRATRLAMLRAYWKLTFKPDILLIDGKTSTLPILGKSYHYNKGDQIIYSISAASIIAKVYRDNLMKELALEFPYYKFDENKGYGTKAHYDSLLTYGLCTIHRKSFLSKLIITSR